MTLRGQRAASFSYTGLSPPLSLHLPDYQTISISLSRSCLSFNLGIVVLLCKIWFSPPLSVFPVPLNRLCYHILFTISVWSKDTSISFWILVWPVCCVSFCLLACSHSSCSSSRSEHCTCLWVGLTKAHKKPCVSAIFPSVIFPLSVITICSSPCHHGLSVHRDHLLSALPSSCFMLSDSAERFFFSRGSEYPGFNFSQKSAALQSGFLWSRSYRGSSYQQHPLAGASVSRHRLKAEETGGNATLQVCFCNLMHCDDHSTINHFTFLWERTHIYDSNAV